MIIQPDFHNFYPHFIILLWSLIFYKIFYKSAICYYVLLWRAQGLRALFTVIKKRKYYNLTTDIASPRSTTRASLTIQIHALLDSSKIIPMQVLLLASFSPFSISLWYLHYPTRILLSLTRGWHCSRFFSCFQFGDLRLSFFQHLQAHIASLKHCLGYCKPFWRLLQPLCLPF